MGKRNLPAGNGLLRSDIGLRKFPRLVFRQFGGVNRRGFRVGKRGGRWMLTVHESQKDHYSVGSFGGARDGLVEAPSASRVRAKS